MLGRPGRLWDLQVLAGLLSCGLTEEGPAHVPEVEIAEPSTGALYRLRAERATDAQGDSRTVILIEPARWADRPEALSRLGLPRREADITRGVLRGASLETLAQETGVSAHTVNQHLRNVFTKLDVSSRRELMARLYQSL